MADLDALREQLFTDYYGKVLGYLKSHMNSAAEAEDLCSEVFLKAYQKLDTFDPSKASMSTWIFTVARNRLTDYFRTRRVFEEVPETLEDGTSAPEEELLNNEMLDTLADALESLPEKERDIIILRYYQGQTLKAAAEMLGISYAYAKELHSKALFKMRRFF